MCATPADHSDAASVSDRGSRRVPSHICLCNTTEEGWRPCPPSLCELPDHDHVTCPKVGRMKEATMTTHASPERWMEENDSNGEKPDTLNEVLRDLLEAAKRVHRITGANVYVYVHEIGETDFFAADHIGSNFSSENGDPEYGHVKGQENAYLSRLIYRGDDVLYQLFASVIPTKDAGTARSWKFV